MDREEQDKLSQEIRRSDKAKQILENPIFNESLTELKKLYTESLFNTGAKETETREKLWLAVNVLGKVEQHIQQVLDTGKLAKKQLEDFRKQEESKKF
jgi:hypothetical protein